MNIHFSWTIDMLVYDYDNFDLKTYLLINNNWQLMSNRPIIFASEIEPNQPHNL